MRILLILGTNIVILLALSVVMRLLSVNSLLAEQSTQLEMQALLIFAAAAVGFAGSFMAHLPLEERIAALKSS